MVRNHSNHETAFTRTELLVIIAALVVLAAIVLPHLIKSRARGSRVACVNNVRYIESSFHWWAMDHGGKYPMQVSVKDGGTMELIGRGKVLEHFLALSNVFKSAYCLVCPADNDRYEKARRIDYLHDRFPRSFPVSYFVGVDADERHPQTLLTGDDSFTVDARKPKPGLLNLWTNSQIAWTRDRHRDGTWVAFAGGVEFLTTRRLQEALAATGVATNRLAMP